MSFKVLVLGACCIWASEVNAQNTSAIQDRTDLPNLMHSLFISVCFDTDWIKHQEKMDVEYLGFTPMNSSSPRRTYQMGTLALLSLLDPEDNREGNAVCTLSMKPGDSARVREIMSNWPYANSPTNDEIVESKRFTTWSAKYSRQSGTIVMEEVPGETSTTIRLSLIGDQ